MSDIFLCRVSIKLIINYLLFEEIQLQNSFIHSQNLQNRRRKSDWRLDRFVNNKFTRSKIPTCKFLSTFPRILFFDLFCHFLLHLRMKKRKLWNIVSLKLNSNLEICLRTETNTPQSISFRFSLLIFIVTRVSIVGSFKF